MNTESKLLVTDIQRFCMHDGPGIRTTVFLKGCPLRCEWCHNPETRSVKKELLFQEKRCIFCGACVGVCQNKAHFVGEKHIVDREKCICCGRCAEVCPTGALEICGKEMSVSEIVSVIEKDSAFYGKDGGATISGGEPFVQPSGTIELLCACKQKGISTAVETCGFAETQTLVEASEYVDLFLWDIKDTDPERHRKYTGVPNGRIFENLRTVREKGAKIRFRCIVVNGVNTDEKHYRNVAELAKKFADPDEGVELLLYHTFGGSKAEALGLADNGNRAWIPNEEQMLGFSRVLKSFGVKVRRT